MFRTPFGIPASTNFLTIHSAVNGVSLLGFSITVLPVSNAGALKSAEKFSEDARTSGIKILTGGRKADIPGKFKGGYFFEPTLLDNVPQNSVLFQEEIFGPILGAAPVSSIDEAIEKSNDSKYGLASYLFTKDPNFIFLAAEKIRFGEVYVNMPGPESSQGYHTGFRMTGQAGEGSKYGIEEYVKLKNMYVDYSGKDLKISTIRDDIF